MLYTGLCRQGQVCSVTHILERTLAPASLLRALSNPDPIIARTGTSYMQRWPAQAGQVCEFDALLSILERTSAPAGLPRAPSAPHPHRAPPSNPTPIIVRTGAPGGGCRIVTASSDSLALHTHRGAGGSGHPNPKPNSARCHMATAASDSLTMHPQHSAGAGEGGNPNPGRCRMATAASDSLAMQPQHAHWAAAGGHLGASFGTGTGAVDDAEAELGLGGFGAKFGAWPAGDAWDVLSSGEAVQQVPFPQTIYFFQPSVMCAFLQSLRLLRNRPLDILRGV